MNGYSGEKVIILNTIDNVGIIKKDIKKGEKISIDTDNLTKAIIARENIPYRFKIALCNIKAGEKIIKSGEVIGQAKQAIKTGDMVHVHNIEGLRGRGDLQSKNS